MGLTIIESLKFVTLIASMCFDIVYTEEGLVHKMSIAYVYSFANLL